MEPFLCFEDIERLILPPPDHLDRDLADYVRNFRRNINQHRINWVNNNISTFKKIWPSGQPVDFFIALLLSEENVKCTFRRLKNPEFTKEVLWVGETFGYHSFNSEEEKAQFLETFEYSFGSEDETDSELDSYIMGLRNGSKWDKYELDIYKECYSKYGTNFSMIAKQLDGRTTDMCREIFPKIVGQLEKRTPRVNSITIVKDGKRYTAGDDPHQ